MNTFMNIQVRVIAAQAQRMLAQLQRQIGGLSFAGATASSGMFGRSLGNMRLDRIGSQMQWLGRQIEYNFTLPLTLAGAAATQMALENEAAFTRITKVYGDAAHGAEFYENEIKSLQKAFVALSNQFGIAQADALNIAADWAAAGASGLALAKSVQLTMKTMVLGELDAATATQSLIAIQAQYGLSINELADAIDTLNMVENQTGISMRGLIEGFTRAAGVARASGVSIRELAADLAALTPATGSATNAGNALKTIFSRLISPTKDTSEVLKQMGINTADFAWQSSNAQEKLIIMAKSFDTLSDAQKGFVSSIIASRYQVNRFEVLMQELLSANGYYQRALTSTADKTAVYAQAQKELNQVLTSNPQRLKVIWTMLQNATANIIQPLIPLILWLATLLQNLVQRFSNLNPSIQKFVLFSLALLAAIGPIVRYLGAVQVLIFELANVLRLLLIPLGGLITLFKILIVLPITKVFTLYIAGVRGMIGASVILLRNLPIIWATALSATQVVVGAGMAAVRFLYTAALFSLGSGTIAAWNVILGIWAKMVALLNPIIASGMVAVSFAYRQGLMALQAMLLAFAAFSGRVWRLITYNPLILVQRMWAGIIAISAGIIPKLRTLSIAVMTALSGPWGAAIVAIVALIAIFWKQIKQAFVNGINFLRGNTKAAGAAFKPLADAANAVRNAVVRAFNALPAGIRNALLAVVNTIAAAAKAVYKWFSFLNPWARHSPSLVDNVTTGVAAIIAQYSKLTGIGSVFAKAGDDLEIFANATKAVNRSVEQNRYNEIRGELLSLAADAVPAFDRLIRELFQLEDQLKEVERAYEAQEAIVDGLKDQLDSANDALDAQKNILQQMKDEADKYQEAINAINGDLEVLTGTREALRVAGAGSDILGPISEQIDMLKDQKKGIEDQLTAAEKAYLDQKKLVEELTAARDKLQASYDLEKEKLDAIGDAYDKIRERIQDITSAINDFATAADQLKGGKEDAIGAGFAAGAGANFPDVGGSGILGREGGIEDQAALIDQFTKEIEEKTKNLFGLFNFLDPIKKAWNKAWSWVKDTFGPIASFIGQFFANLFTNIPNPFAGLDTSGYLDSLKSVAQGIFGFFEAVWRLIGPPIKEIGTILKDSLGRALEQIGPELAKFKDLVKPIGDLFKMLAPVLKVVGAIIGGVLLLAINILVRVLANALEPVLNFIIDIIKAVIKILRGLIEFIVGVFTGNWSLAWQGIKDFFGGIWDAIWSLLKNAVLLIWGIIKGLVEGIWSFFKWIYDELIGHSIIPDIVNGIVYWFELMATVVKAIWNAFMDALKWIWENLLRPVFEAIKAGWNLVVAGFRAGVEFVKNYLENLKAIFRAAWDTIKIIVDFIKNKFWEIVDRVREAVLNVKSWIDDFIGKLLSIRSRIAGAFDGIFDGLKNAFKNAVNWIIGKWNNLSFGVGPFSADTPNLPFLARGGLVADQAMAIVGEGRRGYPEYVIPTDPQFRKRALMLFEALGNELGFNKLVGSASVMKQLGSELTRGVAGNKISFYASGGILGRGNLRGNVRGSVVILAPNNESTYHFHGNMEFPNVKNGNDAEEFIKNLRALVGA